MLWKDKGVYFLYGRNLVKEIALELDFKEWERFQLWEDNNLTDEKKKL